MKTFTRVGVILSLVSIPLLLTGCTQGSSGQPANTRVDVTFTVDGSAANGNYEGVVKDATGKTRLNVIFNEGETMVNDVRMPTDSAGKLEITIGKQRAGDGLTSLCQFNTAELQKRITAHYDGKKCTLTDE